MTLALICGLVIGILCVPMLALFGLAILAIAFAMAQPSPTFVKAEWIPCSSRMLDCETAAASYDSRVLGKQGFYNPATGKLIICNGEEQCPPPE